MPKFCARPASPAINGMTPEWAQIPIEDNGEPLVDLAEYPFVLDPEYFEHGYSDTPKMYLRKGTADKLLMLQESLMPYRIKIWDAWRPLEVQKKLYAMLYAETKEKHPEWSNEQVEVETTKYVNKGADQSIVPPHATGGTADLTLVDAQGNELDMGTGFDHFGPEAAPFYFEEHHLDSGVISNRTLLRDAMLAGGFCQWPHEWWHFEYGTQNWTSFYKKSVALYGLAKVV